MSRFICHISINLRLLLTIVLLLSSVSRALAQSDVEVKPYRNVMDNLFQSPEHWSGSSYARERSVVDRLYFNLGAGAINLWRDLGEIDNSVVGDATHLGVGYNLSPVHAVELGVAYNNLGDLGRSPLLSASYLFDLTSYAFRLEDPHKWQLLLKSGFDISFASQTSLLFNGAMRMQYNATPSVGLYIEPNIAIPLSPYLSTTAGSIDGVGLACSLLVGASFNLGNIVDGYYRRQSRIYDDLNYLSTPFIAIKSNLLYDLVSVINLGLEVPIGERYSIVGEYIFPWWILDNGESDSRRVRLQLLCATLEARYWLGCRDQREALTGWFVGLYGGLFRYDVEYEAVGYQGDLSYMAGVSGGYSRAINNRGNLRMEASLGVGLIESDYHHYYASYIDSEWHSIEDYSGIYRWMGPIKAEISLVWLWRRAVKREGVAR